MGTCPGCSPASRPMVAGIGSSPCDPDKNKWKRMGGHPDGGFRKLLTGVQNETVNKIKIEMIKNFLLGKMFTPYIEPL